MLNGRTNSSGSKIFLSRKRRRCWLLGVLVSLSLPIISNVSAQVETWYEPTNSLTGGVDGARFGASVSCGVASTGFQDFTPLFAVGAPAENNGAGAVYIYKTNDINAAPQRIVSPNPGAGKGFGTALAFIDDYDGAGSPELVITEPNPNGTEAKVWVFKGGAVGSDYSLCDGAGGSNPQTLPAGSGDSVVSLGTIVAGFPLRVFAVGSSARGAVDSFHNSLSFDNSKCEISRNEYFSSSGAAGSGYGYSISSFFVPSTEITGLLSGAPTKSSLAGAVELQERGDFGSGGGSHSVIQSGAAGEMLGTGVAGDSSSRWSAFSGLGTSKVYVNHNLNNVCSVSMPLAQGGSQTLAYAPNLTYGIDAQFAVYRAEARTGGSVGLVRTSGNQCTSKTYTNCILDELQEQGSALTSVNCWGRKSDGSIAPALLVGAPGYQNSRGRVDLIVNGSELQSAKVCPGTEPPPTPTPRGSNPPGGSGDAPILVQPGQGGLPAPKLSLLPGSTNLLVEMPVVAIRNQAKLAKLLQQRLRIRSQRRAQQMAASGYELFYEVRITTTQKQPRGAVRALADLLVADAEAASISRKTRTKLSRDRTTLMRVQANASVEAQYRIVIKFTQSKQSLFTRYSPVARINT
jgi:hypothetical protein